MKYSVQIAGAGAPDMPPSILFLFGSQRYLFNCPEGSQRFCLEHKVRLPKMKNIMLTRIDWETMGGVPGMLLTLTDSTSDIPTKSIPVHLHGPINTNRLMASMRHFIRSDAMSFRVVEKNETSAPFKDENVTIDSVIMSPFNSDDADGTTTVVDNCIDDIPLRYSQCMQGLGITNPPIRGEAAPIFGKPNADSIVYLIRGPTVPGKFSVAKAQALGLAPGPLYGQLQKGNSVTTPNGTVIEPHQVMGPSKPGQLFVIIDFPSVLYVQEAHRHKHLAQLLTSGHSENALIFYLLGKGVADTPEFIAFVKDTNLFHPSSKHILLGTEFCGGAVSFKAFAISHSILNKFAPRFFPPYQVNSSNQLLPLLCSENAVDVMLGKPLMEFEIEPKFRIQATESLNISLVADKVISSDEKLRLYQSEMNTKNEPLVDDGDWEAIPLGTGSAQPSTFRNVSSYVVSTPNGPILLDCGEGTLGQLSRLLPIGADSPNSNVPTSLLHLRHATLESMLQSLRLIFISHLHADHHIGLIRILRATDHQITIIGPWRLWNYLRELNSFHPLNLDRITFIDASDLLANPDSVSQPPRALHIHSGRQRSLSHRKPEANPPICPDPASLEPSQVVPPCSSEVDHVSCQIHANRKRAASKSPTRETNDYEIELALSSSENENGDTSQSKIQTRTDSGDNALSQTKRKGDINQLPSAPHVLAPLLKDLQLSSLHTAIMVHRSFSYAIRIVSSESADLSIVYSGDTRPTQQLIQLGRAGGIRPGLLIHEATFESDMRAEAIKKQHSTTADAIHVFEQMDARALLLTHFSQRYPKLPKIEVAMRPENIVVAFDLLTLPLRKVTSVQQYGKVIGRVCSVQSRMMREEAEFKNED